MIWEKYAYPIDPCKLKAGNSYDVILEPTPVIPFDSTELSDAPYLLSKTGSTNGFGAYVFVLPDENFAGVMLANKNYPNGARLEAAYNIMSEVLSFDAEYCQ